MFRMKNKTLDGDTKEKITKNWGTYAVLLAALGAMTFFGVCTPGGGNASLSGNAASVGDQKISYYEFRRAYQAQSDRLRQQYAEDFDAAKLQVARTVMDQLVNGRVLYIKALKLGLESSEDEVVDFLSEATAFKDDNGKFSEEYFKNYLRYNNYTQAAFMEEMKRNLTVQKLRQFITSSSYASSKAVELDFKLSETKLNVEYIKLNENSVKVEVASNEVTEFSKVEENKKKIKEWYDSHQSDYSKPEKVHARHLLVSFKGARNASAEGAKRSKEDAKKRAESLLTQLKSGDFAAITKKETDEQSGKKSGGDLGFFTREAMVKPFSDAAFLLKKGEISGLVESPFGFHIINLVDRQEKTSISLADAEAEIAKKLIEKEKLPIVLNDRAKEILASLGDKTKSDEMLKKYSLSWKKTGLFGVEARSIPGLGQADDVLSKVLKLKKDSPLLNEVVEVGGAKTILRLVERQDADLKKLDDDKMQQLSGSSSFSQGYAFYNSFEKSARKEIEKSEGISVNPKFLALDTPSQNQGG